MIKTQHYVTFLFPGAFMPEDSTEKINHRDPTRIDPPDGCYVFYFHDRVETMIGGEFLHGSSKNRSKRYHVNAKLVSLEEIGREFGEDSTIYWNVKCNSPEVNGVKYCIEERMGNTQFYFPDEDEIIEIGGKKK